MEIFSFQDQFHVIGGERVYASFPNESEATAWKESYDQGTMQPLTDEQTMRLLTKEELLAGKKQEPQEPTETFQFIRTGG